MVDTKKTGVGYYVNHLITALGERHHDQLDLIGYYSNFMKRHPYAIPTIPGAMFRPITFIPNKALSLCRRLGFQPPLSLLTRLDATIIFFTNYVAMPVPKDRKVVLAIYDLSFLDCPEFMEKKNAAYLQRFSPPSILRADTIITISQFTKDRLLYHFPQLAANIIVTPIPPLPKIAPQSSGNEYLRSLDLRNKGYILYLGTIEPRKNVQNLVNAYSLLPDHVRNEYPLVLAGGKGWRDEDILASINVAKKQGLNIVQTGYINQDQKEHLYSHAACFVFPSHYEGFGMPILEAMQHNVPVAVSNIPVFKEVAGGAALYFDKDNAHDIALKIEELLTRPGASKKLAERARKRLSTYSWDDNTRQVYDGLRRLSQGGK